MYGSERISRRKLLVAGATASAATVAGCLNNDNDDNDVDLEEWEDIDEFYFEGVVEHWTGIEPDVIEDEENPTLHLIEGQEYDFRWVNGDGVTHNLEIWDEDDEIIDNYQSDDVGEEGEETTLEGVAATEEMVTYVCQYHRTTQVGDLEVHNE
ncbi:PKD domain-containing protein [Halobacteria archaeon AArc-curdl1]|uniref:PKD domain-containing protein n=1 Tax=Natronosalvus hydrolyticus TaxID=2979988 RepID=A0AAP2Z5V4_9EURY|nr:PKD domain-containing protein [Halobacteria archaeon AArc-curdl1]